MYELKKNGIVFTSKFVGTGPSLKKKNLRGRGLTKVEKHCPNGPEPPHYGGFTITLRNTTLGRTPLKEWSARRRDLSLTKHCSLGTDFHAPGGVWNRNPSKRAAASPRLRQRGSGIGHCYWYAVNKVAGLSEVLLYPRRLARCRNPENYTLETVRI